MCPGIGVFVWAEVFGVGRDQGYSLWAHGALFPCKCLFPIEGKEEVSLICTVLFSSHCAEQRVGVCVCCDKAISRFEGLCEM